MNTQIKKTKILIPIDLEIEKDVLVKGLALISKLKKPVITLLHIIELPVTASLDIREHHSKVEEIELKVKPMVEWLKGQSFEVNYKIAVARYITSGIVEEANSGDYDLVILTKRKPPKGIRRLFYRSHTDKVTGSVNCPVLILVRKK
ncbi:MAG: universal stress protein [Candidatus Odinarchaeia archaeon]